MEASKSTKRKKKVCMCFRCMSICKLNIRTHECVCMCVYMPLSVVWCGVVCVYVCVCVCAHACT